MVLQLYDIVVLLQDSVVLLLIMVCVLLDWVECGGYLIVCMILFIVDDVVDDIVDNGLLLDMFGVDGML